MPTGARAWVGLAAALLLVAAAFAVPQLADWEVWARASRSATDLGVPPLHGYWQPKLFGPGTLPAVAIALLAWWFGPSLAERLSWGRLLLVAYVVALAWLLSLAFVDGADGIGRVLGSRYEYLPSARGVTDVPALFEGYVARIPVDSTNPWPTHPAGHPPGALLFFVLLDRLGLGGSFAAGSVVTALAATTAVAVLVALRALGAEQSARRAATFLVLTPAAVFMAVSADALFGAIAAWGLACLALATRAQWVAWSVHAGILLGWCVMSSYGLPLLGILAVAVLVLGRSWRPLPVAAAAAIGVVLVFAASGFSWWEAFPVLRDRYWDGVAADRPASYWMWGNLAALVVCAGPVLGSGLAVLRRGSDRVVVLLASAAAVSLLLADLSQMSRAEVERIWLPFVPWLLVSCALLPERWRRWGLALQLLTALVVQHLFYTVW
jgi:methylthioxylose transferase